MDASDQIFEWVDQMGAYNLYNKVIHPLLSGKFDPGRRLTMKKVSNKVGDNSSWANSTKKPHSLTCKHVQHC